MEPHGGVFVSSLSTEDWEPDHDPAGETHVLCDSDGVQAGLQRFLPGEEGPIRYTPPAREVFLVLEGEARIEIAGGPTLEVKVGDFASIPKGAETTWHLTTPYKEFWVLA